MSSEIKFNWSFNVTKGNYNQSWTEANAFTMTTLNAAGGIADTTTSAANLDIGAVATLGFVVFKNLDSSISVDVGINSSGFIAFGTLKAGEVAIFRFKAGVVPQLKAASGTPQVSYLLLND